MNAVFIDTSAFYALLDADDTGHTRVRDSWEQLLTGNTALVTSNYILVETFALMQNRLGMAAVRAFQENIVPLLDVLQIDAQIHAAAASALLAASRKHLSLVDCSSFEVMRRAGIRKAFTLDRHFKEQGFETISSSRFRFVQNTSTDERAGQWSNRRS